MSVEMVKLDVPFESLLDSIAELRLVEKRRLSRWLDEQIARAEQNAPPFAPMAADASDDIRREAGPDDYVLLPDGKRLSPSEFIAQLDAEGLLPIPAALGEADGLKPLHVAQWWSEGERRMVTVWVVTRKALGDAMLAIAREAFKGVSFQEAWAVIKKGRADDVNRL